MSSADDYLRDVIETLLERARRAKARAADVRRAGGSEAAFADGMAQAYYEVTAHMVGQLDAFGIDRSSVGLRRDFDPEADLL